MAMQQFLLMGVPGGGDSLPLDTLTASFAVSTRKLRSKYLGSCVRLRRSSDNAESDFGFSGNRLDATAISAWAGADTLYVVTWYDQSGNGYNATQADTAKQGTLVLSGLGGNATIAFDGANQYMLTADANSPSQAQPHTVMIIGRALDVTNEMLFDGGYTTAFKALVDKPAVTNATWGEWRFGSNPFIVSAAGMGDIKYNLLVAQANGASSFLRVGGYQVAAGNGGTGTMSGVSLAARGFNPTTKLNGNLATAIVLPGALTLSEIQRAEMWLGNKYALNTTGDLWNIVCEGDSRTAFSGELTYPKQLVHANIPTIPRARITLTNSGVAGQQLHDMWLDRATTAALYDATKVRNILVLWGGTNDFGAGADEPTVLGRFLDLVDYFVATGFEVIGCTELPRSDVGKPANFDANRAAFNTHVRDNAVAHNYVVADLGANSTIGDDGDENDTNYYNADKLHLIAAGYAVVASVVAAVIE